VKVLGREIFLENPDLFFNVSLSAKTNWRKSEGKSFTDMNWFVVDGGLAALRSGCRSRN
jgi:hypothetical protein